jgi:LmbE family N-acetylglucosaminyl deacetylase
MIRAVAASAGTATRASRRPVNLPCETDRVPFTLVSFHAHPDDEALLTGGTLARAAAEGHRVVIVCATAGEAGLADDAAALGERRLEELRQSSAALGCARVEVLGYPDSGWDRPTAGPAFARMPPEEPARRLAALLVEERADVLTIYDAQGGYGHPDHVQVFRVGSLAARLAGTPVVLEATIDRDLLQRLARLMAWMPGVRRLIPPGRFGAAYTPTAELTHRVDVRPFLAAKRAALAAHASQASGGTSVRTMALLLRFPTPLLGLAVGREWFREQGRTPSAVPLDDVFATLR